VNLVSDQKRRAGGTLAPKANQKHLPARASVQGGQPVRIEGLTSLSGYLLRQAQLFVFHDFNQRLAPLDLRPAQYSVLSVTRENPGLSQMALSHVLGIGRSGIVPLLDVLEARGLLMRRPAADRRSHALYLTAKGSGLLARADVLVQQNQDRTIDKIGRRNHEQLLKILEVFGRPE
jgi:DNA-binding MarR family transcriptional regulator